MSELKGRRRRLTRDPEERGLARGPKGRGAAWTEERGTSDEGRRRLDGAPEASGQGK